MYDFRLVGHPDDTLFPLSLISLFPTRLFLGAPYEPEPALRRIAGIKEYLEIQWANLLQQEPDVRLIRAKRPDPRHGQIDHTTVRCRFDICDLVTTEVEDEARART